jgi:hypothetical protein
MGETIPAANPHIDHWFCLNRKSQLAAPRTKNLNFERNREFDERDCHSTFAPLSRKQETGGVDEAKSSGGGNARL